MQWLSADFLHHQTQQDGVGVAVFESFTGRERVGFGECKAQQFLRGEVTARGGENRVLERLCLGVVEQSTLHARQLPQCDLVAFGDTVDELGDRLVQPKLVLIGELQHPGDGECLCHAAYSAVEICLHRGAGGRVGHAERTDVAALGCPYADDRTGDVDRLHGLVDRRVEPLRDAGIDFLCRFCARRTGRGSPRRLLGCRFVGAAGSRYQEGGRQREEPTPSGYHRRHRVVPSSKCAAAESHPIRHTNPIGCHCGTSQG